MENNLKEKLKATTTAVATAPQNDILTLLNSPSMKGQIAKALPRHLNAERFARIALTAVRLNPNLLKCSRESFFAALLTASQLGLEPNTLGQAYLIPYGKECQFQIGYMGLLNLVRRSGEITDIYAEVIFEKDEYEIEFGLDRRLVHRPNFDVDNRGKIVFAYAVAKLKDGSKTFMVMSAKQILKRKAVAKTASIWSAWEEEMYKKTILKAFAKTLPLSTETIAQIDADEKVKKEFAEDMTEVPEVHIEVEEPKEKTKLLAETEAKIAEATAKLKVDNDEVPE